jgi:fused signal recognition particle receptor
MIQTLFGSVEQEPTLLERLKSGVEKTRAGLVSRLEDALAGKKEIDAELLDELEYTLIGADIGVKTTNEILERIRQQVDRRLVGDAGELRGLIRQHLLEILESAERPLERATVRGGHVPRGRHRTARNLGRADRNAGDPAAARRRS